MNQAIGYGIGEKIKPFACQKPLWFVLIALRKSISTKAVYQIYHLKHGSEQKSRLSSKKGDFLTKKELVVKLPHWFLAGDLAKMTPLMQNDLQEASGCLYPAIRKMLRLFEQLGVRARLMAGSGSTVFAAVSSRSEAKALAKAIQTRLRSHKKIFISHTL